MARTISADANDVAEFITSLFMAAGLSEAAAGRVANALIEADLSRRGSHGILQADAYIARLVAGSMSAAEVPRVVSRNGAAIVLDAANMQGHLAAEAAVIIGIETAREFGVAAVAVRRAYHIGVVGRYVRMAAEQGCVGIAMCNTKPVMAAPGGAEKLVGTNPLAIGLPVASGPAIVLDMATTAGTVGRIRQAQATGQPIPPDWAIDAAGRSTTDAGAALKGILLPMSGPKGFGLSFVIDLLVGLLSSGGWGASLGEMRGDLSKPLNSALLFLVLDVSKFRALDGFLDEARRGAERVRTSRRMPGTDRLYTPGERSAEASAASGGRIIIGTAVARTLADRARSLSVAVPDFLRDFMDSSG